MKNYFYGIVVILLLLQGCALKTGYKKQETNEKIYLGE